MDLLYLEDYWDNDALKAEFNRFLNEIFRLDLSKWDRMGYWDRRFRPFSYFDGDRMVANVCVYSLDMTVAGKACRAAQVSSVATAPDYQRRGLSLDLMNRAIAWARDAHDFHFLFADQEAIPFYRKCGFRTVDEHKTRLTVSGRRAEPGLQKLDLENQRHRELIVNAARERTPVSDRLGVVNWRLFMFWCSYYLKDQIHYMADLDVLVLFERKGEVVTVSDIVGKNIPDFATIYRCISAETDKAVEFLFIPDRLGLNKVERVPVPENGCHLLGDFPLEGEPFIFPLTCHA